MGLLTKIVGKQQHSIIVVRAVISLTSAIIDKQPNQPGDVPQTWADICKAKKLLGYLPKTSFSEGIQKYIASKN